MGFINNLFSLFGSSRQSERRYFNNRTEKTGGKGAVYLDTETPYNLVNTIPQLKIAVDKIGTMFSNAYLVKEEIKTGKIIEDAELQRFLEKPNITQSQNAFLKQYISQLVVYGNQFMFKNKPSALSKYPSTIINISPANLQPVLTGKYFEQTTLEGIIEKYVYRENNTDRPFAVNEILWNKIEDLDNPLIGTSPIKSMKYPLTNTKYAYDYLNVISADKGAIGIISISQKDGMGAIPMSLEEKDNIERSYTKDYGTGEGQKRIHLTQGTAQYTPMSYPTAQLLLLEQIDTNFLTILSGLGINPNVFISSTYENLKNGLIMTYQDTIIPYADAFTQALSEFIGVEKGFRIVAKFDHISILQDDKSVLLTDFKTKSDSLNQLVASGIITAADAKGILANDLAAMAGKI